MQSSGLVECNRGNTREQFSNSCNSIAEPLTLLSVYNCLADFWFSCRQLAWGIYDHTHYHLKALFEVVAFYFQSMPRNFAAHYAHQQYLRRLGFTSADNSLTDGGTLVWKNIAPEGNALDGRPAQRVTGLLSNATGNPAHLTIASLALEKLWTVLDAQPTFRYDEATFVDFGCGTGLAVVAAMTRPFAEVKGVELHEGTAAIAQHNVDRFLAARRDTLVRCETFQVLCADMSDFDFKSCTGPAVVLYLYEPLWTLGATDAHQIYERILRNAARSGKRVMVAYFFCGLYSGNALPALFALGAEEMYRGKYSALEFGSHNDLYLFNLPSAT